MAYSPLSYKQYLYSLKYGGGWMIQKDFGWACKRLREEKGLSQEKFALLIEMDRTYYASVEAVLLERWNFPS